MKDPREAKCLFLKELLGHNAQQPTLFFTVDATDDAEEQERSLISFYKEHDVKWAAPLKCRIKGVALNVIINLVRHV